MGNMTDSTEVGAASGPLAAQGLPLNATVAIFTSKMSASYATGGDPVVLPAGVQGEIVAVDVLSSGTDFANRTYIWNGQTGSDAKIVAMDAFKTQEGNATDLSGVTLTLLAILKQ